VKNGKKKILDEKGSKKNGLYRKALGTMQNKPNVSLGKKKAYGTSGLGTEFEKSPRDSSSVTN